MVESFLAEIAVIHPGLVPLVRIAILMAVGLVCWLVISVPTLVLWLAGEGYFVAARRWLEDLAKLLWHVACRLWDGLPAPVARFIAAHRLRFVFDHNEAAIRHALGRVGQKAGAVTTSVAKLHEKLHGAVRKMTKQLVVIAALEIPDVRIEVPEAQEVVKQTSRRRRGVVNLVTGLVMGLILIAFNTGMLNEFFGSFVSKRLYGVPLSLILAVGFSAFEVSIGIFIFMLEGKVAEGNDIRANIWEIIAYLTVLCLIAIECYFYSMLSASMDVGLVSELFAPDRVPAWLRFWLAPFGFVVVIGLVFMGHTFIEGLDQVRENGAIGQFRREMRKVQRIAQTLGDDFGHARESLGTLNLSLSAFHTELVGNDGQGPQASVRLEEAATAMKQAANDAAQARREPYACVAEADGLALLRTHLAFAIATLVAIGVLVWGEILFLRHLGVFGDAGPGMVTMISAGQALLVLGAGWLLVPKVRLLPDDASQQLQSSPGRLSLQIAAIATLIFVGGFNVFLTLGQNGRPEWLWLAILLGCISFIAAVGSALPVLIAACWVAVETVGLAIGSAVVAVAALLAWFSAVTVAVLRAVLHWVAFPAMKTVELIRPSRGLTSVLPAGAQSDR